MSFVREISVLKPSLNSIETNATGVNEILSFYSKASSSSNTSITYDLQNVANMDANLSALLVASVHKLKAEQGKRVFVEVPKHMNVLFRNGMVAHLMGKGNVNPYEDDRKSTIPLFSFSVGEDESFSNYLHNDFFGHRGLDILSLKTKQNLRTQFVEVFNNVELHANSKHPVFTCGQYFPQQKILKFTMVDLGDGFLQKINEYTKGLVTTDTGAIEWALSKSNTTKNVSLYGPGGTGLKDLKSYCEANNGSLQIASGSNLLTFVKGKIVDNKLTTPMQGAVINLIFRGL